MLSLVSRAWPFEAPAMSSAITQVYAVQTSFRDLTDGDALSEMLGALQHLQDVTVSEMREHNQRSLSQRPFTRPQQPSVHVVRESNQPAAKQPAAPNVSPARKQWP